jgi:hypothetical protein
MTHLDPRALEAAVTALEDYRYLNLGRNQPFVVEYARAAVTAYLESAPPIAMRVGDFVLRPGHGGIWIGRANGEGGEFSAADVETALAQFYRANF